MAANLTRRAFLARVLGTVAAAAVLPRIPLPAPVALPLPPGPLGLSIRFIRAYDVTSDQLPTRLDVLYGVSVVQPAYGCRVSSE